MKKKDELEEVEIREAWFSTDPESPIQFMGISRVKNEAKDKDRKRTEGDRKN